MLRHPACLRPADGAIGGRPGCVRLAGCAGHVRPVVPGSGTAAAGPTLPPSSSTSSAGTTPTTSASSCRRTAFVWPSLFDATWHRRLEDERQHRRCKVYGPALHHLHQGGAGEERRSTTRIDITSWPPCTCTTPTPSLPSTLSQLCGHEGLLQLWTPSSPHLVGSLVHLTTECIEALHRSLGLGVRWTWTTSTRWATA